VLRRLRKYGKAVRVILTNGAREFISPINFQALGAEEVYTEEGSFKVDKNGVSLHLSLARWADAVLIAPATANFIANFSHGVANSLPYTALLAFNFKGPIFVAPAMNSEMLRNPITQENFSILRKKYNVNFIGPEVGELADGTVSEGRFSGEEKIVQKVVFEMNSNGIFSGKKIIITAGSTREYIDPVRFITNGSSGTMGISIAIQSKLLGAYVHLIAGDVKVPLPLTDKTSKVETTEELLLETHNAFKKCDILIMAAAPADFKALNISKSKIKKTEKMNIEFMATPDILRAISAEKKNQIIVGFALQTESLEKNALRKMKEKHMDIVVANSQKNIGTNSGSVILIDRYGRKKKIKNKTKEEIAKEILHFLKEYIDKEAKNG
jgi:phosphopantothenoylcysteine decarboxylase/phosphopantothenate--cysteine ligase